MLKDGLVAFEGNAAELRASTDPYIQTFLVLEDSTSCRAPDRSPGPN